MSQAKKYRFPFFSLFGSKTNSEKSKRLARRRLLVESMEDRRLMATDVVADISSLPQSSSPDEFVQIGSTLYYAATTRLGRELHYHVDSPQNPGFIAYSGEFDLNPGIGSSEPEDLTIFGDSLYFSAYTPKSIVTGGGREVWVATGENIRPLKDIMPGIASSDPKDFTVVGNTLYFTAISPGKGRELWKTNGTALGTQMIRDIHSRPGASSNPRDLVAYNGKLYFTAEDGLRGRELWQSDGTTIGTKIVRDIEIGASSSSPTELTVAGNKLYFAAWTSSAGREIWTSDGTYAGTKLLSNIASDTINRISSSTPKELTAVGDNLYFTATTTAFGRELYRYEPQVLNTVFMVRDIAPGPASSDPTELTAVGLTLYFVAHGSATSSSAAIPRVVWKSHGVGGSFTEPVQGWNQSFWITTPKELTDVGGTLYFSGFLPTVGQELFQSGGTPATTKLVKNINPGSEPSNPKNFAINFGKLHFSAYTGNHGFERFVVQSWGVESFNDFKGTQDSNPTRPTVLNNEVYWMGHNGIDGYNLYKHNPATNALTTVVTSDQNLDIGSFAPGFDQRPGFKSLHVAGDNLFFSTNTEGNVGRELWKTTGTSGSNLKLKTFLPSSGASLASINSAVAVGNNLYFLVQELENGSLKGTQLWKSNGTAAGTVRLKASTVFYGIDGLTVVGDRLYFVERKSDGVSVLWKSDGTNATTSPINLTLNTFNRLVANSNTLFFQAGADLYRTDGTISGTQFIKNIYNVEPMVVVNEVLYFSDFAVGEGVELWKSDGTTAGTSRVKDINPGAAHSFPKDLTNVNGKLYFTAETANGRELWMSDGTEPGTKIVKDILDGVFSSTPTNLVNANGKLYFSALSTGSDGQPRQQVMVSDGTPGGTKAISGELQTDPKMLTPVGDALYYSAIHKEYGRELTIYQPNPVIGAFDGTINFVAGSGNVLIDTNATVTASNVANFQGGKITFRTTTNAQPDDRFSIRKQGTGPGQISYVGSFVTFGGDLVIGTQEGGMGQPLVITFNANATAASIQALIRNIYWRGPSSSTLTRTITVSLTDAIGGNSLKSKNILVFAP